MEAPLLAPARAFRLAYLPLLSVYLASGALGIIAVADQFWVKKSLTLTPAELASLAVWLQLPWTAKMVFSEFVDARADLRLAAPRLHLHRRRPDCGGPGRCWRAPRAAGSRSRGRSRSTCWRRCWWSSAACMQEVVADAMSPEVVARTEADGSPRPQADINRDLAMVEVLARLAYSLGAFARRPGWPALLAKTLRL